MENFPHSSVSLPCLSWVVGGPSGGGVHLGVMGSVPGWKQRFARTVEAVVPVARGTDGDGGATERRWGEGKDWGAGSGWQKEAEEKERERDPERERGQLLGSFWKGPPLISGAAASLGWAPGSCCYDDRKRRWRRQAMLWRDGG